MDKFLAYVKAWLSLPFILAELSSNIGNFISIMLSAQFQEEQGWNPQQEDTGTATIDPLGVAEQFADAIDYDSYAESEVLERIASLDPGEMRLLYLYEKNHKNRPAILEALSGYINRL